MKTKIMKLFAVIAIVAFMATSCSKTGVNCGSLKTIEKLTQLGDDFIENPSVETCTAYVDFLAEIVESCDLLRDLYQDELDELVGTCVD